MSLAFNQFPVYANSQRGVLLAGGWTGAGAADPTKIYGRTMTIARQGVGVYRITLANKGTILPNIQASIQGTAPLLCTFSAYNVASGYIDITCITHAGVATELSTAEHLAVLVFTSDASAP